MSELGTKIQGSKRLVFWFLVFWGIVGMTLPGVLRAGPFEVVGFEQVRHYLERFNQLDVESVTNYIPNSASAEWIRDNVPRFNCPDTEVEEVYYFRWWVYRKHIKQTPAGFVITEFLKPVRHAGVYNTISCATGHHISEGRWLWDQRFIREYILFWLRGNNGKPQEHFHKYSSWFAWALYQWYLVNADKSFVTNLLDDLVADYLQWERERLLDNGLFWQFDVRDGMEESISGSRTNKNARPSINSYMYGNALAIASFARLSGREELAREFEERARRLRDLILSNLWDPDAKFFKVRLETGDLSDAREAIGFIPWAFKVAPCEEPYLSAWCQLMDPEGFWSPFGPTTAERRHPLFRTHGIGRCEWDGAVWPFAVSQTLTALANVLQCKPPPYVTKRDYFATFLGYVRSHRAGGEPYIGEYLDETSGAWINGRDDRSRHYNHSTFADLIITGLVGVVPTEGTTLRIHPLVPEEVWEWFCLDMLPYKGHSITIVWDKTGKRYNLGPGLSVFIDGRCVANVPSLSPIEVPISN